MPEYYWLSALLLLESSLQLRWQVESFQHNLHGRIKSTVVFPKQKPPLQGTCTISHSKFARQLNQCLVDIKSMGVRPQPSSWRHEVSGKPFDRSSNGSCNMNSTRPPVLVVGAGPAGSGSGGVDTPPEQRPTWSRIWPRSLELFNFLNVPEVNDLRKFPPMSPKAIDQQLLGCDSATPPREILMFRQGGCYRRSSKLAKNGMLETFDTKWMIGADGAKSAARKQPGPTLPEGVGLNRLYCHQFENINNACIQQMKLARMASNFSSLMVTLDLTKVAQSEELIFKIIASLIPTEITLVWASEFQFVCLFLVNIRMVNKFNESRVFIAGDAAHVHSPTGGQVRVLSSNGAICSLLYEHERGLNSSVQDAVSFVKVAFTTSPTGLYNLGWKLALVEKGVASISLLETYNAERLPVISEMLEMTTSFLNQSITSGCVSSRGDLSMPTGYLTRGIWKLETGRLKHPICCSGARRALPDDAFWSVQTLVSHCDCVRSGSRRCYSDLGRAGGLRQKCCAIDAVLPLSAPVTPIASPADLVFEVDRESYAYSAYPVEAGQTKVFVIRPAGVIGAIVHGAEGMKR
ncbi:hypothetical protein EDB19DRAFT_1827805 [Suillus lakei]|nr:hypothetical protein EDB19DRAFT_1827805 [Suillus lakei]